MEDDNIHEAALIQREYVASLLFRKNLYVAF
jgi:hypothetical protein